ncbi:MAG: hypothetical protein H6932_02780 [Burkholderiaceae bacterium]|nr:hypothetical protein [Burkholderiaceae bacterium]
MSHLLDFIGFEEGLVVLEHFAHGSRRYCANRRVGGKLDQGEDQLDKYWSWLKGTVGAKVLECAIKFRVLCDTAGSGEGKSKVRALDAAACAERTLCTISEGNFEVSLRELSNKIIHATHVVPVWGRSRQGGATFKYWSGQLELSGTHQRKAWKLSLNVSEWAAAMQHFLHEAEANELTTYIGQDWYPKQSAA